MHLYLWIEHSHQVSSKSTYLKYRNVFKLNDFTGNFPEVNKICKFKFC